MSDKGIIAQIFDLKAEYHSIKDMIDVDPDNAQGINFQPMYYPDLLRIRKDLSCLSSDLAKETSSYFRKWKKTKAQRETQKYLKQRELMDSGMKVTQAEAQSKQFSCNLLEEEAVNEGLYKTGDLILKQVNEILSSVKQDISVIRKEYESINDIQ